MTRRLSRFLRRFTRDERGSAIMLEFVIFVPILFAAFLMSVELSVYSIRQMFLDRGLEMSVRYVRLNTGEALTHRQFKDMVCANSGFIPDCSSTLRIEMSPAPLRGFTGFQTSPDCVDISEPIEPVRGFTLGQEQDVMLMRACVGFKPVFPTTRIGRAIDKDGSGRAKLVAVAAFVQEPG